MDKIFLNKSERRELCLTLYKALGRKLTISSYTEALKERGIYSKRTGNHFSKSTLEKDLWLVRKDYAKELASDSMLLDLVSGLMANIDEWLLTHPNAVTGAYKLLSEWLDMPNRLSVILNDADRQVSITDEEYVEYLKLKSKKEK